MFLCDRRPHQHDYVADRIITNCTEQSSRSACAPTGDGRLIMPSLPIARLAAVCKQHGPGRMPYADRREIGAGYAMATTAVVASVAFMIVMQIPGIPEVWPTGLDAISIGLLALPIVIPSAFVSGVIAWRVVPSELSWFGPVAGLVATGFSYWVGVLIVSIVLLFLGIFTDPSRALTSVTSVEALSSLVSFLSVVISVAFMFTFWATLPLGTLGGYVHERARETDATSQ